MTYYVENCDISKKMNTLQKKNVTMIQILKIHHNSNYQIAFQWEGYYKDLDVLKKHSNIKYSQTHGKWYIPYSEKSYSEFLALNVPFSFDKNSGTTIPFVENKSEPTGIVEQSTTLVRHQQSTVTSGEANIRPTEPEKLEIRWNNKQFYVSIPFTNCDVTFLKGLQGSYWNAKYNNWVVRATVNNLEFLQKHFNYWDSEVYSNLYEIISKNQDPGIVELYVVPDFPKFIAVSLRGYRIDVDYIKRIPERRYDQVFRRWLIPNDKELLDRLITHYEGRGVKVINRLAKKDVSIYNLQKVSLEDSISKLISKFPVDLHPILKKYTDGMIRMSYRLNSISLYVRAFGKFCQYVGVENFEKVTDKDVNSYISMLVKKGITESLHNIIVSAIKLYYEKIVYSEHIEISRVERPRGSKYLPTILSAQEVDRMLRTMDNIKHIAIAYFLYGSGLRLSEVLNLRVQDVYWDRNQLLIKDSKGKKDRYNPIGERIKELLVLYYEEFKPEYWLFEGQQAKQQYSRSSVSKIISRAAKKAGISRKVTPHTLRHCYATHLLDNGTDVRLIQELLGHKDIKTTLIYTHITNQTMNNIQSPLDRLSEIGEDKFKKQRQKV